MSSISTWHYILIGNLIFNAGVFIGGGFAAWKGYRTIVDNHLKHLSDTVKRIENKVCANDKRIDDHAERLARVEERTKGVSNES